MLFLVHYCHPELAELQRGGSTGIVVPSHQLCTTLYITDGMAPQYQLIPFLKLSPSVMYYLVYNGFLLLCQVDVMFKHMKNIKLHGMCTDGLCICLSFSLYRPAETNFM